MAELIDKGSFIEDIKTEIVNLAMNGLKGTPRDRSDLYRMIDRINEQPTTTEAEIRAKAYDRFLTEMLNEFDSKNADIENHTGSYVVSRLHKIAEQLKGE